MAKNVFTTNHGYVVRADAGEWLKEIPANFFSTVITDPPYGLSSYPKSVIVDVLSHWVSGDLWYVRKRKGFHDEDWDGFVPSPGFWSEVYRVCKPGATLLVFAGSRTQDLMSISLRLAGFEVKDIMMWLYGSGFPKANDIARTIDKMNGAQYPKNVKISDNRAMSGGNYTRNKSELQTEQAKRWDGYKSHNLKPAYEPIIVAMKPNDGSYASNALEWGVAGLNMDAARIPVVGHKKGRYPTNVILDEEAARLLDTQAGESKSTIVKPDYKPVYGGHSYGTSVTISTKYSGYTDEGGRSRFFYVAKASEKDRNVKTHKGDFDNIHPTVKPYALIEYLVKMTKMPDGTGQIYLDPFFGSGTLGVVCERLGLGFYGIEVNPEYFEVARKRLTYVNGPLFGSDNDGEA